MTPDWQLVLESDLLVLRPMVTDDFEVLYALASDPAIWEQHPAKDRTQEPVFRRWFVEAMASQGALVVVDKSDQQVIGTSRYVSQGNPDEIEIGWTFLATSHWGGTYNGEMKHLMLAHAFRSVQTVVFTVHSANIRSQRAVQRLGAVRTDYLPDADGQAGKIIFRLHRSNQVAG